MKRLLTAVILLSVVHFSESAYAQATFIFNNYIPNVGLNAPVFDAEGNRLVGTHYVAILYGGPTQDSLSLANAGADPMSPVAFTYMPMAEGGYFRQALGHVSIDTVPSNDYAWLQVRAWDLRLGQTYDEVAARGLGGYGESMLFYARGGGETGVDFPRAMIGLESFSLRPIPEPGACVLFALGLGLLLHMYRQRKSGEQFPKCE